MVGHPRHFDGKEMMRIAQITLLVVYLALLGLIVGCDAPEYYRYPCMNPKKWEREDCKRPLCAITQECPDQLLKPEEMKGEQR